MEGETILQPSPSDGVSSVRFAPSTNVVLAGCWDSTLLLYDANGQGRHLNTFHSEGPVLDSAFLDNTHAVGVGIDQAVRVFDLNEPASSTVLGHHSKPIRCANYAPPINTLFTGGWDAKVMAWDPRSGTGQPTATLAMPDKVFTMDLKDTKLVVGTAGRRVVCYDLRNLHGPPLWERESSLKFQTRALRCFPDGQGFALASIEGRVSIEYFDPDAEAKKYAFKCHRIQNTVFPVNAIAFHPGHGTFATGGCDGFVNVWDGKNKKRLCQLPSFPTSVAALDFNHDGTLLAVAASYTFEEGEKDHPADQIYIRAIGDSDVRPKPRVQQPAE